MTQPEESFIKEIESELRDEKIAQAWQKWRRHIIAGISFVALTAFAVSNWNHYQHKEVLKKSKGYISALILQEEGNKTAAKQRLESLSQKGGNYGVLASINNNTLDKTAHLKAENEALQNYKTYLTVLNSIGKEEASVLKKRLKPLLAKNDSWKASAMELKGFIEIQAGQNDEAKKSLESLLALKNIPESLRLRSLNLLSILNVEKNAQKPLS